MLIIDSLLFSRNQEARDYKEETKDLITKRKIKKKLPTEGKEEGL